jgi:hypothetical protein
MKQYPDEFKAKVVLLFFAVCMATKFEKPPSMIVILVLSIGCPEIFINTICNFKYERTQEFKQVSLIFQSVYSSFVVPAPDMGVNELNSRKIHE